MEPAARPPPPRPVDFFVVGLPLTLNGADDSAVQSHFNALIEPVLPSNAVTNNPASLSAGHRCPRSCLYSTVSQQRALRTKKPPKTCNVRVTTRILRIGCRMKFQEYRCSRKTRASSSLVATTSVPVSTTTTLLHPLYPS